MDSASISDEARIGRPKGAKTRWPGIGKMARRLRTNESHLRAVLSGKRQSEKLLARYAKLISRPKPNQKI